MLALPTPTAADAAIVMCMEDLYAAPLPQCGHIRSRRAQESLFKLSAGRCVLATMLLEAPGVEPEPSTEGWSSNGDPGVQ